MSEIDSVLLVSFGGPEGPDDVLPFLENVTRGRRIPPERLQAVAEHYYSFGGISPINEQNRQLIAALRQELDRRELTFPIAWGNRNWLPYIGDAIDELEAAGLTRPLIVTTSAYSSYSGCRQYRDDIDAAIGQRGLAQAITAHKAPAYFDRGGFIEPFADGLSAALRELAAEGHAPERTSIFFTTHSIPMSMAAASGPDEARPPEGAYVAQHRQAMHAVLAATRDRLHADSLPSASLVYQSRSGAPHIPWLEPDINDAIRALDSSMSAVVIVPIGFVSDHLEVVWDLDHEARITCEARGFEMRRVATPGTTPAFVSMLADLVAEASEGRWADCPATCCLAT